MTLSEEEFNHRIGQLTGAKQDGNGNWVGIRLLTPTQIKERADNAEKIRQAICSACGADERTCGSGCLLMQKRIHKAIAAMIPPGVTLRPSMEVKGR